MFCQIIKDKENKWETEMYTRRQDIDKTIREPNKVIEGTTKDEFVGLCMLNGMEGN